jgi:hypothetical protein
MKKLKKHFLLENDIKKSFFCFVHIEKTAGTTLHNVFHRCIPGYVVPMPNKDLSSPWVPAYIRLLKRFRVFPLNGLGGHRIAAFAGYESEAESPIFYFTILREPIARYISHLNWLNYGVGRNISIDEFIDDPKFNNRQTIRIAGSEDIVAAKKLMEEKFMLVGILEKFDECMVLLNKMWGNDQLDLRYERTKVHKRQPGTVRYEDLSQEVKTKIVTNNALDIELYKFLNEELYPRYLAPYKGDLAADVDRFRESNKGYRQPKSDKLKRFISTWILKKVIQPAIARASKKI